MDLSIIGFYFLSLTLINYTVLLIGVMSPKVGIMGSEHGTSFFSIDGDIIIVKVSGAFNSEGIGKSIEELKAIIDKRCQNEFKLLFDYTTAEGGTPEVFEKINECNIWLNSQKMTAKAVVINSGVLLTILESRTPARSSQNSKNFDNKSDAIKWLKLQC